MTADRQHPAIVAATRMAGFDPGKRLADAGRGQVPVVPRQWFTAIADASVAARWRALARDAAGVLALLTFPDDRLLGRQLPKRLERLAHAHAAFATALEELSWFLAPQPDPAQEHLVGITRAATGLLRLVGEALDERSQRVDQGLAAGAAAFAAEGDDHAAALREMPRTPENEAVAPRTLVESLFELPSEFVWDGPDFDVDGVRVGTPLSTAALQALSRRLIGHLLPESAQWVPSATDAISLLIAERPLIAHRCALSVRRLVERAAGRDQAAIARVLAAYRSGVDQELASHREIIAALRDLHRAQASADNEGAALAVARCYAAVIEGPVSRAAALVLELAGGEALPEPTLGTLRERLNAHARLDIASDLAACIEPEWRNAIDHRQVHWDARTQTLILRDTSVPTSDVFDRQALGTAAVHGLAAGVRCAITALPTLFDAINLDTPIHRERALVEQRFKAQFAANGVTVRSLRTVGDRIMVRLGERGCVPGLFGALVANVDDLRETTAVEVTFDDAPRLLVATDLLRRASDAGPEADELAMLPVFAGALIALDVSPDDVLDRAAQVAVRPIWKMFPASEDAMPRSATARLARELGLAAARAKGMITGIQAVTHARTERSTAMLAALAQIITAAKLYERNTGDLARRRMLDGLTAAGVAHDALPRAGMPWFVDAGEARRSGRGDERRGTAACDSPPST